MEGSQIDLTKNTCFHFHRRFLYRRELFVWNMVSYRPHIVHSTKFRLHYCFFMVVFLDDISCCLHVRYRGEETTKQSRNLAQSFPLHRMGRSTDYCGNCFKRGSDIGDGRDVFTSGWCWINASLPKNKRQLWTWITGKAWEVIAYILIFVFYFMLKFHIRKQVSLINH